MLRGLYVGRFQPPHRGHVEVIKNIMGEVDELIIVIGSAQLSHTFENPFTAGERVYMLREAIKEAGVDLSRVYIIPIPDIAMNHVWPRYVTLFTPEFHVVYSGNPLVRRLFQEARFEVRTHKMISREKYSGKYIRRLMLRDDPKWKDLVPPAVAKIIEEIGGVERIKEVTSTDELL